MRLFHTKKNKLLRSSKIDLAVYIASIVGPFTAIPQLQTIWLEHSAKDVSLVSSIGYTVLALVWLAYGLEHRDRPIMINSLVWAIIDAGIVAGVLLYS